MRRRNFLLSVGATVLTATSSNAGQFGTNWGARRLRIALDTSANHVRNMVVERFADMVEQRTEGALTVAIFPSGQLANDRDTPKAIRWGLIDMAVPALTKLSRYIPYSNILTLPMMYGANTEVVRKIIDGKVGTMVLDRIAAQLDVRVLGAPIDLGHTHVFTTTRRVTNDSELAGMKIRIPGGRGQSALYRVLEANPVVIPFGDLPIALSQGNIDAVQSTYETIRSARLWESSLRHCYEDHSSFLNYVPLISRGFWNSLSDHERNAIASSWLETAEFARKLAAERQEDARHECRENGIEPVPRLTDPSPTLMRKLSDSAKELAVELGIDPAILEDIIQTRMPG